MADINVWLLPAVGFPNIIHKSLISKPSEKNVITKIFSFAFKMAVCSSPKKG